MIVSKKKLISWYLDIVNGDNPTWYKIKAIVDTIKKLRDEKW